MPQINLMPQTMLELAEPQPVTAEFRNYDLRRKTLPRVTERPVVKGKFLFVGEEKFYIKGVSYGTFRSDEEGNEFRAPELVREDFAAMAANGVNTVRTYTVPPRWLLDLAQNYGLRVMVGLPWEQHIAFLDEPGRANAIEAQIREYVRACTGHPAVLCYTIGNEIPASIVRWYGRKRIEKFLARLYQAVKSEDPAALVTYVNFPTTEYLQLPFVDLLCFNVYLETRDKLEAYLARLHNLSDDRPLLMAEIGLDSRRNGKQQQAQTLDWQIRMVFESGACGAIVFAWTDEWYRGGHDIEDWDFGLTTRERLPKPALSAVSRAFTQSPFPTDLDWPRISVVVCSLNGAKTIRETLEGLQKLDYPDYEVIVINDGSTDETPHIVAEYPVTLISTENRGLSSARNTGMEIAKGEIVAYIDDDAYPDPHWLRYLAFTFMQSDYVGVGGPNLPPPGDGAIADCVANAPGGPIHVLLSDRIAEHIPGCNMAFRKKALQSIGGFDPVYRAAGDDVDICWRLQARGGVIGFSAAAMVWHHRRNTLKDYWRQQQGYGKAEALLEAKWPEKYNTMGHLTWAGRLYGKGPTLSLAVSSGRIYHGIWGSAPFQSLYQPAPSTLLAIPLMPEWYLLIAILAAVSILGLNWAPLWYAFPLLCFAASLPVAQALLSAKRAKFTSSLETPWQRCSLFLITTFLHLKQPLARLIGRLKHGLSPWRRRSGCSFDWPIPKTIALWREKWQSPEATLEELQDALRDTGPIVAHGSNFDRWDLEVRSGLFGGSRILMAVEEHGGGNQMLRLRIMPRIPGLAVVALVACSALAIAAAMDAAWFASIASAFVAIPIALRMLIDNGTALGTARTLLEQFGGLQEHSTE